MDKNWDKMKIWNPEIWIKQLLINPEFLFLYIFIL